MFATCIFCHSRLGRNDLIEALPVGQRVAFDAQKGRLWIVCLACDGWNLTPLEERWEALEQCERSFRSTTLRASTSNVGLAHVGGGLELVRIGKPLRPELAIWRYGRTLRRRRWQAYLGQFRYAAPKTATRMALPLGLGGVMVAAAPSLSPFLGLLALAYVRWLPSHAMDVWRRELAERILLKTTLSGRPLTLRAGHVGNIIYRIRGDGWRLEFQSDEGKAEVEPEAGLRILAQALPLMNRRETSSRVVRAAVASIERAGSIAQYLRSVPDVARTQGLRYSSLARYPRDLRVGLEIAAQEEFERRAMETELHDLETAWREAEEIAAIADNLLVPPWVDEWVTAHTTAA
jgi:hypothetical protein